MYVLRSHSFLKYIPLAFDSASHSLSHTNRKQTGAFYNIAKMSLIYTLSTAFDSMVCFTSVRMKICYHCCRVSLCTSTFKLFRTTSCITQFWVEHDFANETTEKNVSHPCDRYIQQFCTDLRHSQVSRKLMLFMLKIWISQI